MIKLEQVVINYPKQQFNFDLSIATGQRVAIVGTSGAGKTTLLEVIAGFVPLTSGKVIIDGAVTNHKLPGERGVAYMTQENNHLPHFTIAKNINLALLNSDLDSNTKAKLLTDLASEFEINDILNKHPSDCSGGQLQRAALIRCLLLNKKILLLDEPFSALDQTTATKIINYLKQKDYTVIIVTHHLEQLRDFIDRVILNRVMLLLM